MRLPQTYCVASPRAVAEVATRAEELGFYGVSVQDHLVADSTVSPCGESHVESGDDRDVFEALQTLAFAAARTDRVRLVTGVLVLPLRNAVLLAKELAALDVFSGGRLLLGVGVGASPGGRQSEDGRQDLSAHARISRKEFDALGVRGHRGHVADEAIQVMKGIWADGAASFHGEHHTVDDLPVFPKPMQEGGPPIWVGGRSEASRRRAVVHGDGWFPSQISAEMYADGVRWMRALAAAEGRDMPADLATNIFAIPAATDGEALAMARRAFGDRFTPEGLATTTLVGCPDTLIRQIRGFVDAGVTCFDLKLLPPTLDGVLRAMDIFATEIAPAFAGAATARP